MRSMVSQRSGPWTGAGLTSSIHCFVSFDMCSSCNVTVLTLEPLACSASKCLDQNVRRRLLGRANAYICITTADHFWKAETAAAFSFSFREAGVRQRSNCYKRYI